MSSKKFYDRFWDSSHKPDPKGHVNTQQIYDEPEVKRIFEFTEPYLGKKILDIGSGEGDKINYVKTHKKDIQRISAIDISENAHDKAVKAYPWIDYKVCNAEEKIPYAKDSFDTVLLIDVIEHIYDVETLLTECSRVLLPTGNIVIVTPEYNFLKRTLIGLFFWNKIFYPLNPHIRFFTRKTLKYVMAKYGFEETAYRWGLSWFHIMPQNMFAVYKKV